MRWIHILLIGSLHLKLIHGGAGLRNIQLVGILGRHNFVSPFVGYRAMARFGYRNNSISCGNPNMRPVKLVIPVKFPEICQKSN